MASINNLSIPAIVIALYVCSLNCSSSFRQFFKSSPPEILRLGHDPGPQRELHVLAILEVPSTTEVCQASKCKEIAWRDVRGIWWMGYSYSIPRSFSFCWVVFNDAVSRCPSGTGFCPGVCDCPPFPLVVCRRDWSRQFHLLRGSPSKLVLLSRRRNTTFLAMGWSLRNGLWILIEVTPFKGAVRIIVRNPTK